MVGYFYSISASGVGGCGFKSRSHPTSDVGTCLYTGILLANLSGTP